MPKNNKYSFGEYILKTLIYYWITIIMYYRISFRSLPGQNYYTSKLFYLFFTFIFLTLGMIICSKRQRNRMSAAISTLFPVGVYTCITYYDYLKVMIIIVNIVVILLSLSYAAYAFMRKVKNKNLLFVISRRLTASLRVFFAVGTILYSIVTMTVIYEFTLGNSFKSFDTVAVSGQDEKSDDLSPEKHMDIIMNIQRDNWKTLSVSEKLKTLQFIANIEAHTFGLPHELNVRLDANTPEQLGSYSNKEHNIYLNVNILDNIAELMPTLLHECFHAYQQKTADIYNKLPESDKKLALFRDASIYANEFNSYKNGNSDFKEYYYQKCETDARNYADAKYLYYSNLIRKYITENS